MWNTPLVLLKKKAAEIFCKKHGYEYRLVDIKLDYDMIKEKYLNGEITFLKKYKEKFEKYRDPISFKGKPVQAFEIGRAHV